MPEETPDQTAREWLEQALALPERTSHGRIVAQAESRRCLDAVQLSRLEQSFREWVQQASKAAVRLSRRRILLIFLLIRYTGARLHEVLALDPWRDIDFVRHLVTFGRGASGLDQPGREVQLPATLAQEIHVILADEAFRQATGQVLQIDPGHVRRKFYERAQACGFPKELGGPDALRRSRAVELLQLHMPLPVVQRLLGHSTPNLTAALVSFSETEIRQVARFFLEKEAGRKTSARNTFFGKITTIRQGDIQTQVEMVTLGGDRISTVITNDSLVRLGLQVGKLIVAEVKAPWVILCPGEEAPACSAENCFRGTIARVLRGQITAEYVVRMADGTELCAVVTSATERNLALQEHDPVWATFNSFAVVLRLD